MAPPLFVNIYSCNLNILNNLIIHTIVDSIIVITVNKKKKALQVCPTLGGVMEANIEGSIKDGSLKQWKRCQRKLGFFDGALHI
jgi:hypothetical protein